MAGVSYGRLEAANYELLRKLTARPTIVPGTTTANWNTGVATSGLAGADLVTLGTAGQWLTLNQCIVVLTGFNAAATITIREYMDVVGINTLVMEDVWIVADDPIAFLGWWIDIEIYGPYRIELYSDQALDDGWAAIYEYRTKQAP